MRTWSVALVAVCIAAGAGCSKDPEVAKREYVASGDKYATDKQLPEAIIQYRNAVALDPRFGEARLKLGNALIANGDTVGAYREYIRAADLLPGDAQAQMRAGQMHLLARQFPEARARAEALLKIDPKNADALILMGNAMAGIKDFEGAVTHLEQAIETNPS